MKIYKIRFNYNIIVYNIILSDAEPFNFVSAPADIFLATPAAGAALKITALAVLNDFKAA